MTDPTPKVLDLAALDRPLEPVRFTPDGELKPFHHLNAMGEQLVMKLRNVSEHAERRAILEQIVRICIPSVTDEDLAATQGWKLDLLVTLAGETVASVEEYMGKFRGVTSAAEASTSETPSATLSPA